MSNGFTFINQEFLGVILCSAIMLLALFVWKEWKNKRRLLIRVLVSFVSITSLVLIALKPANEDIINKGKAVILTNGYQESQLDSLKNVYEVLRVLDYSANPNFGQALDSVTSTIILGYGIESYDLWQFDKFSTTYIPSRQLNGLTKIKYKKEDYLGSEITISGEYRNPIKGNHLAFADAGDNVLDSIEFKGDSIQKFNLKGELKVAGKLIYNLIEKDSSNIILAKEPLPIIVADKIPLKILIINTYPTFETKYLKNFLANRGHMVTIRSQLTENRYKFEYINTDKSPIYGLTEDVLANLDLLIIDADSYFLLSSSTQRNLHKAIEKYGLGLFLQPNEGYFTLSQSKSFFNFFRDGKNEIIIENKSKTTLQKYPFEFELSIDELSIDLSPEVKIGARKYIGVGKVATTTIFDTYHLVLNGKQDIYNNFWTVILDEVSKNKEAASEWETRLWFPRVDEPFEFKLRTSEITPEVTNNRGNVIPLLQDINVSSGWEGIEFPRKIGWNQLKMQNDTITLLNYYVFDSLEYASIRNNDKIDANLRYFNSHVTKDQKVNRLRAISPFWFYGLFLLGIGYLWLEPKI